jgi:NAD(P)-dependent dehydrogenase (short-subunit alcohol dehydrogenase family)
VSSGGQLDGVRAIVTGGARGIGAGVVRSFTREGAQVTALDVRDDLGADLAAAASETGPGVVGYARCDVSDRAAVNQAFDEAAARMGGLDVLIHVAGIQPAWHLAEDIADEVWDRVFDINVKGTLYTNQAACLLMKPHGYGKIVNFSSMAGVVGSPGLGPYSSSKAAQLGWTRTVAKEWGRYGIRVNAVNPYIQTPLRGEGLAATAFEPDGPVPKRWGPDEARDRAALLVPGRTGLKGDADDDLGPVLVFLATRGSDFITGQMIQIDGGVLSAR